MYGKNRQKGQGLVEYLLMVAVVVVAVVAIATYYKSTGEDTAKTMQTKAAEAITAVEGN